MPEVECYIVRVVFYALPSDLVNHNLIRVSFKLCSIKPTSCVSLP